MSNLKSLDYRLTENLYETHRHMKKGFFIFRPYGEDAVFTIREFLHSVSAIVDIELGDGFHRSLDMWAVDRCGVEMYKMKIKSGRENSYFTHHDYSRIVEKIDFIYVWINVGNGNSKENNISSFFSIHPDCVVRHRWIEYG